MSSSPMKVVSHEKSAVESPPVRRGRGQQFGRKQSIDKKSNLTGQSKAAMAFSSSFLK
jgi:hypothetical protein